MDWAEGLAALDAAQRSLLALLAVLGLASDVHGQPGWPFARRLALETLAIDRGLLGALATSLALAALALSLAVLGLLARRVRWPAWAVAAVALLGTPWPSPTLVLAPALPTSFHRSPTGFSAAAIVRGERLYREHCSACHGDAARGDGPRAASLVMWPPDLTGALLWRRPDGELFWRVLRGMTDRHGRTTMPGFGAVLDDQAAWSVLDFLAAQAAGESLRRSGAWTQPVQPPDAPVRCAEGRVRSLREWRGQRLRLIVTDAGASAWREDPRLHTVALGDGTADCTIVDPDARQALARIAGVEPTGLAGQQFLVDRSGWLRARAVAGAGGWSEDDLVCRASSTTTAAARGGDGLDALIARMDAEPVRGSKGGVPH